MIILVKKEKLLAGLFALILSICVIEVYINDISLVSTDVFFPTTKKTIVIDAGHGGWDPGKVSQTGTLEKDVNLAIAEKLQHFLEQSGATVILTRSNDTALSDSKRTDLSLRKILVSESQSSLLVSIHQNSYPAEEIKGAQVFYYTKSENSKQLAESVQQQLISIADKTNKRAAKSDDNYYLLKNTEATAIIVECGFLSSPGEEKNLLSEDYQEKIAWAIYKGIISYYDSIRF